MNRKGLVALDSSLPISLQARRRCYFGDISRSDDGYFHFLLSFCLDNRVLSEDVRFAHFYHVRVA